jgi:branched-chain amino acid transport system substrate-binding protein
MQVLFQAVKAAGSVKAADIAKALPGRTYATILGDQQMRRERNHLERTLGR